MITTPSTHISIVSKSLSQQYDEEQSPKNLLVFKQQGYGQHVALPLASEQHTPMVKVVLVVLEGDEGIIFKQLVSFLNQQSCFELSDQNDAMILRRLILASRVSVGCDQSTDFLVPSDAFLVNINSIIESHLEEEDYRPSMLAKSCFLCEMQLHRKLKKLAQLSPSNYIRKYRMWRSKSFLKDPTLSISEVCCKVGIRSLEYFSRSFRQEFGVSPSMFRAALSG